MCIYFEFDYDISTNVWMISEETIVQLPYTCLKLVRFRKIIYKHQCYREHPSWNLTFKDNSFFYFPCTVVCWMCKYAFFDCSINTRYNYKIAFDLTMLQMHFAFHMPFHVISVSNIHLYTFSCRLCK